MTHEGDVYSLDIMVKRTLSGNYMNQAVNDDVDELIFRIAFAMENKSFSGFRIAGVRNASSDYAINDSQILREVKSVEFTNDELAKIRSELKTVLNDYINYMSLVADPRETSEDKEFYKTSFVKLFKSGDIRIYNDIIPEPQTSLISVNDYLLNYIAGYPEGVKNLSINADSVKFGNVLKAEEGNYYTYVRADKFFSGSFKGKDLFRKMLPLTFKISFNVSEKAYTDFAINSIDISSLDFYQAAPGTMAEQKPAIILRPVTRKGFGIMVTGSFGRTQINSKDIASMTVPDNQHSWNISPLYGFLASLSVSYNFNDHFALRSGLEFSKYSTSFNLKGNYQSDFFSSDVNYESFNKIVEADFDSVVTVQYITLPLLVNYTSSKPGRLGFFAEGGIKVSFPVSSTFSNAGNYKSAGYYPDHEPVIRYLDLEELGFINRQNINETGDNGITGMNFSFYGSLGLSIPLGYYSSLTVGPEVMIGLSDILKKEKNYLDIFGKSYDHQPTKINSFGIRISFVYKL